MGVGKGLWCLSVTAWNVGASLYRVLLSRSQLKTMSMKKLFTLYAGVVFAVEGCMWCVMYIHCDDV